MQFLVEADLVRGVDGRDPIIGLSGADLSNVKGLDQANLEGANLSEANLSEASLSPANLSGADLSGADLKDSNGITGEELERQAKTLKGGTMPNGQKYEDWLKDK